jgi:hypothetical protein
MSWWASMFDLCFPFSRCIPQRSEDTPLLVSGVASTCLWEMLRHYWGSACTMEGKPLYSWHPLEGCDRIPPIRPGGYGGLFCQLAPAPPSLPDVPR